MLRCGSPGYAAPEVLNKEGYGLKADVFSCGVILYVLLTGVAPFYALTIEEMIERNKKGNIEFPEELWKNVSPEAKDLVRLMTLRNQEERISAQECLDHIWITKGGFTNELHSAISNMKKYCNVFEDRFDVAKIKPDFGIHTSTPLMRPKKICETCCCSNYLLNLPKPQIGLDSTRLQNLGNERRQKYRKYSEQHNSAEFPPIIKRGSAEKVQLTSSFVNGSGSPGSGSPTSSKICEEDDTIPDEISPKNRNRANTSVCRPFSPGKDKERSLPVTPGTDSMTKRTLDVSTFCSKTIIHPQSNNLKRFSQFYTQASCEENKGNCSQTTVADGNSPLSPLSIIIIEDGINKQIERKLEMKKEEKVGKANVSKVRKNLLDIS